MDFQSHEPLYAATCSDYFQVTATVPIVAGSGSRAYAGIKGKFSLTLTGNEDQKTPTCRARVSAPNPDDHRLGHGLAMRQRPAWLQVTSRAGKGHTRPS